MLSGLAPSVAPSWWIARRRGGHPLLAREHGGRVVGASAYARVGHGVRLRRVAQGRGACRARRRRPARPAQPPPTLSAQSVDALRAAGYTQEEIDRMIRDKVVAVG